MPPKDENGKRKFTPFLAGAADKANDADLGQKLGRSPQDFPNTSILQRAVSSEPNFAEIPKFGTIGYGTIIQTTLYDQWTPSGTKQTPDTKSLNENSIAQFRWGEYAIQKQRWCIVLHMYIDSYVVLPIYTNSGSGIRYIPMQHKNNYLRMYDPRAWGGTKPESLTDPSNRDLHVDMHGSQFLSRDAWVRATFPDSLSLLFKPVKIVGYLTPVSAQKLRNYFDRRPFDRQIMTPAPRNNERPGIGTRYDSQRSSGDSERQTRSRGPADPIEIGPNKRIRVTPNNSQSQRRAGSSGARTSGGGTFTYNPNAEFRPGM